MASIPYWWFPHARLTSVRWHATNSSVAFVMVHQDE
jgi:hypothetical protein